MTRRWSGSAWIKQQGAHRITSVQRRARVPNSSSMPIEQRSARPIEDGAHGCPSCPRAVIHTPPHNKRRRPRL
eukprot:scaffold32409_cov69-Phaeocystis_antarctica.AAC.2